MIEATLRVYFESFTGNANWEDVAPHFDRLFHDDLVVVTPNGEVDRAGWMKAVQGFLDAGSRISVQSIRENGDTIYYSANIEKRDGTNIRPVSKGFVKDGKLSRVEPMLPRHYAKILDA